MIYAETIEADLRQAGFEGQILGCDEAGRGPLAGPVTAACVVFDLSRDHACPLYEALNDSKKLTEKKRLNLFDVICEQALAYCIVDVEHDEIDAINILRASLLAMERAAYGVHEALLEKAMLNQGAYVILDGNQSIPHFRLPQASYVKGDARSLSIAAASVLAKVHRDQRMLAYDVIYPGYGFAKHKGYPTKNHREAIQKLGVLPIHRKSFSLLPRKQ